MGPQVCNSYLQRGAVCRRAAGQQEPHLIREPAHACDSCGCIYACRMVWVRGSNLHSATPCGVERLPPLLIQRLVTQQQRSAPRSAALRAFPGEVDTRRASHRSYMSLTLQAGRAPLSTSSGSSPLLLPRETREPAKNNKSCLVVQEAAEA